MFSLIALYFASRREVLLAERYVAGLTDKPAAQQPAAVPAPVAPAAPVRIALAA